MLKGIFLSENNEVTGSTQNELEYTFLVKTDIDKLEELADSSEEYEQWMIMSKGKNKFGGQIRVRCINGEKYIFTVKNNTNDSKLSKETETEVSKDIFEAFKKLAIIGVRKKRFVIKKDSYEFEVDAFYKSDSGNDFHDWVQVDIEVSERIKDMPELPFETEACFDAHKEKDKASEVYDSMNLKKEGNILPVIE